MVRVCKYTMCVGYGVFILDHQAFLLEKRGTERGTVQCWVVLWPLSLSQGFPGRKWLDPTVILGVPQSSLVSIPLLFPYFVPPHLSACFSCSPPYFQALLFCFGHCTASVSWPCKYWHVTTVRMERAWGPKINKGYFSLHWAEVRVILSAYHLTRIPHPDHHCWFIGYVTVYVIIESDCFGTVRLNKRHTGI